MKINGVPEEYRGEYKEAKELLKKSSILNNEAYKTLWKIEGIVLGNVLRDYSILSESFWEVIFCRENLKIKLISSIYRHKKLSDILQEYYHSSTSIADHIVLHFYDNDVELYSDRDNKDLVEFVKQYRVNVKWDYLKEEIDNLNVKLNEVVEFKVFIEKCFANFGRNIHENN